MRSRKLLALLFCLITFPAIAGYMTLLGAGVGNISPTVSWVADTDAFPDTSLTYSGPSLSTMFDSTGKLTYKPNNLALNTAALGTQSVTVQVGTNYLISFASGGGSIALSGAGAGTVTSASPVKITASTATLTLTVTGTVTNAVVAAVTYETSPRSGDQVITTASAYYGPRIDYDPNTLVVKGLLDWEARTNLTIRSGELTHAAWSVNGLTRGTDGTLDLTGATAVKLSATAGNITHNIYNGPNISITSGSTYSESWFVKGGTHTKVLVNSGDNINYSAAVFDISGTADGTATQIGQNADTGGAGTSKYIGNGWFRLTLKFTAGANGNRYTVVAFVGALTGNVFNGYGDVPYSAAGTETIYIGQPQFEVGASASPYIPTGATSVAVAADVFQFTGPALTALQGSAWSAIVETGALAGITAGSTGILGLNASQSAMYVGNATQLASFNGSSGRTATIGSSGNFTTGSVRSAIATDASGRTIVANGGTVSTDGNKAAPTAVTSANLGALNGGTFPINGPVKSFAIYNQRLPDATLQIKSVVGASYAANDNGIRYAFADNDNLPIHWRVAL